MNTLIFDWILKSTLALYLVSLPVSIAGMEFSSWLLFLVFLIFSICYYLKEKKNPWIKLGPDWAIWGFWLVVILGAFILKSVPSENTLEVIGDCRWVLLLYSASAILYRYYDLLPKYLPAFLVLILLLSLFSIYQAFTGVDPLRDAPYLEMFTAKDSLTIWRAKGFFSNTMTYSYSLGIVFFLLFSLVLMNVLKPSLKILAIVTTSLLGVSLILTLTRGLWLSAFIAGFVILFLYNKKIALRIFIASILLLSLGIGTQKTLRDRALSIVEATKHSERVNIWNLNLEFIKENPLLGIGFNRNKPYAKAYYVNLHGDNLYGEDNKKKYFASHAHNNYLQVFAGTGVFGFLLYMFFMGYFLFWSFKLWFLTDKSNKAMRAVLLGLIGAQICFHLGGLTESNFMDAESNHMFIFSIAGLIATKKKLLES